MMGGLRRAHALALGGVTVLILLLLTRLPPTPAALQPRPAMSAAYIKLATTTPDTSTAAPNTTTSPPPPSKPPPSPSVKPPPPQPVRRSNKPPVLLTKDVYIAGHSKPHPNICPALGENLKILILVTSAPSHASARDAVRLTWGHYAARSDIAMAFVLGTPPQSMQAAIEEEDALYGDIIIGNSMDSYSNLTLKTLSMLEWVDTYCPRVPRILKTDDDMFINVPKLLQFMSPVARANATKVIWGKVLKKSLPKRISKSKYYLSPVQFPGKVLPDFATGPAYLMTADCVSLLLKAASNEPYVRLEDVFVTGILSEKLGIRRVHAPEFYNKKVSPHPCAIQRGVAIHMVRYHEQFDLWRKLLDGKTKCAS